MFFSQKKKGRQGYWRKGGAAHGGESSPSAQHADLSPAQRTCRHPDRSLPIAGGPSVWKRPHLPLHAPIHRLLGGLEHVQHLTTQFFLEIQVFSYVFQFHQIRLTRCSYENMLRFLCTRVVERIGLTYQVRHGLDCVSRRHLSTFQVHVCAVSRRCFGDDVSRYEDMESRTLGVDQYGSVDCVTWAGFR